MSGSTSSNRFTGKVAAVTVPIVTPATDRHAAELRKKIIATAPSGRYGEPDDIAHGVAYLASEDAKFISGHNLAINGGRAIV